MIRNPGNWRVAVGAEETTATFEPGEPAMDGSPVFIFAHGAGGHMGDRGILALSAVLRSRGVSVVRFNFLYTAKKSRRPDPMPRLEQCFAAVVARTREEVDSEIILIGGRSMGGRAASMMASRGFVCDGLLLLAYPLHAPGQPEKLRDAHLPSIQVPVLCFNGTRDTFCHIDLMEAAVKTVTTRWDMHWLAGADHGFHVRKASGRTDAEVLEEVGDRTGEWIAGLETRRG